jgi:hypothetical protein
MQLPTMNRWTKRLLLYVATGASFVVAVMCLWNFYAVRVTAKWLLYSHHFKTEVLAQSGSKAGDFKHIEWDGWGWAGSDTTVYLVFDPSDSLSAAARKQRPGKFNGLPCEVAQVSELEPNWYSVRFYTNEFWGRRNALDCSGIAN